MSRFRKKPVVVEAMRWTGNNWNAVRGVDENRPPHSYSYPSDAFEPHPVHLPGVSATPEGAKSES